MPTETTNYKFAVASSMDVDIARIVRENDNPKVFVVKYPSGGNTYFFKKCFLQKLPESITYGSVPLKDIGWTAPGAPDHLRWSIYDNEGKKIMEAAIEKALAFEKPQIIHVKVYGQGASK